MDFAALDVREKMDALPLPLDVKSPTLLRFDPSFDPVMRFAFYDSTLIENQKDNIQRLMFLRSFADEEIKKELEIVLGVASVKVSGGLEDEIIVSVDQAKLAQLKIPIENIANQLRAENVNLSGGKLEEGTHQYLVRTLNQFKSIEEIKNIIIPSRGSDKTIYLKDIAEVKHGYRDRTAISKMKGKEAVEIAIYKEGDANTVKVADRIKEKIEYINNIFPKKHVLVKIYDQSVFINQSVNEVVKAGLIGGLLAIFILYFFLRNFWITLITSLSIPVSVIATFNLMYGNDLTLNIMSLGGITLGIGMLLDNSIVVLENISRHREMGKGVVEAAKQGTSEVGMAITASTLTTIAVFFPLVFVKGIAGQLFRDQALTVTFSLLASLIVALTLIPMLASIKSRKVENSETEQEPVSGRESFYHKKQGHNIIYKIYFSIWDFIILTIPFFIIKFIAFAFHLISKGCYYVMKPFVAGFNAIYSRVEKIYPHLLIFSLKNKFLVIISALPRS